MRKTITRVITANIVLVGILTFTTSDALAQEIRWKFQLNSAQYERMAEEAKESEEGLSSEEVANFFTRNISIQASGEESFGTQLIILFMDSRGSVINRERIEAEGLSNRSRRFGHLIGPNRLARFMERSVPGNQFVPSSTWISDTVPARNMEDLVRNAGQMAIKIASPAENEEYGESYALAFAVATSEGQYDKASPLLAVFRFFNR